MAVNYFHDLILLCGVKMISKDKGPFKFYSVKVGRKVGVFTKWCNASSSVTRYQGAIYKGFHDVDAAIEMLEASPDSPLIHHQDATYTLNEFKNLQNKGSETTEDSNDEMDNDVSMTEKFESSDGPQTSATAETNNKSVTLSSEDSVIKPTGNSASPATEEPKAHPQNTMKQNIASLQIFLQSIQTTVATIKNLQESNNNEVMVLSNLSVLALRNLETIAADIQANQHKITQQLVNTDPETCKKSISSLRKEIQNDIALRDNEVSVQKFYDRLCEKHDKIKSRTKFVYRKNGQIHE